MKLAAGELLEAVAVALQSFGSGEEGGTIELYEPDPGHLVLEVRDPLEFVQVTPAFLQALAGAVGTDRIDIGDRNYLDDTEPGSLFSATFHIWTGPKPVAEVASDRGAGTLGGAEKS